MQKHLKKFNNLSDYETFKESDDFVLPNISYIESNNEITYSELKEDHKNEYLTFEALEDGTYSFRSLSSRVPNIQYSIDGGETWVTLNKDERTPVIHSGNEILWKNTIDTDYDYDEGIARFSIETKTNVKGNIMSLLYGDNFKDKLSLNTYGVLYYIFYECNIINSKGLELPATTLSDYCYSGMFLDCTSLVTAPELPATTLANSCYEGMFQGCTSLVTAPELPVSTLAPYCYYCMFRDTNVIPNFKNIDFYDENTISSGALNGLFAGTKITDYDLAKILPKNSDGKYYLPASTLSENCYNYMFGGCTLLTTAPELPAMTLAYECYNYMFADCTSLVTVPELPATTLAEECYNSMFDGCTSLTTAPELPATTLESGCYSRMFNECTSLVNAPKLPATTLAPNCYTYMFSNCTSLVNAPTLPATTLADYCYMLMFKGCTSLTTAPELPSTTLSEGCYQYMFQDCTSLTTAPELPATTLASGCYANMFYGCKSLTTAPELPATTLVNYCYNNMFQGCSKLNNIIMLGNNVNSGNHLYYWVNNVSKHGTFTKNKDTSWATTGINGIPNGWYVLTQ